MKRVAEEYLGEPVTDCVITVPAYFNDTQRQCTKDAGRIAGLEVLRIINEPTAAALAYGLGREQEEKIAVYDLGGGTFDISILELGDGVVEVLATAGNTFLGGEDFDRRLAEHILLEFKDSEGVDLSGDLMAMQRIKDAAEKAKCDLSSLNTTEINLPFIANDADGARHLNLEVTRETLESLVGEIVKQTIKSVEQCVADAGVTPSDIDHIVLVGGQTRMPMVQSAVSEFFGKRAHKGVNPDEVVAMGAAIQASVLASDDRDLLLLDVTPFSLGIATFDGHFAKLIVRNTTVPARKSHIFTTTRDDQSAVKIRVLQGDSDGQGTVDHGQRHRDALRGGDRDDHARERGLRPSDGGELSANGDRFRIAAGFHRCPRGGRRPRRSGRLREPGVRDVVRDPFGGRPGKAPGESVRGGRAGSRAARRGRCL
jgi:molecular chaperone DnaK